jgi:ornithine--oxo-acid transaminase
VTPETSHHLDLADRYGARNYAPLPVVIASGEGAWVRDVDGRRYLDLLAAYSALNFGHRHPALMEALERQLGRLTLTSRAFHNDQLGPFCRELTELVGMDVMLPMNSGAEAVETAIKAARKWAHRVKGVPDERAEVIVCDGNFHGRTTTVISFSSDPAARDGYGPYTPGFTAVPFGDVAAFEAAITDHTAALLIEPVQGERGVVVPPAGYLRRVRELCDAHGVLLIADEIQSGLGRTGRTLACQHEDVTPDLLCLGKALGGGLLPVSAVLGTREVMDVLSPGTHGSTFGGNPLACAVGRAVIELLRPGDLQRRSAELGARVVAAFEQAALSSVTAVRGQGLWVGVDVAEGIDAHAVCERLLQRGLLLKEAQDRTLRIAPPLTIEEDDLDWAIEQVVAELRPTG